MTERIVILAEAGIQDILNTNIFLLNWIPSQAGNDRMAGNDILFYQCRFRINRVVQHPDDFAGGAVEVNTDFSGHSAVIAD